MDRHASRSDVVERMVEMRMEEDDEEELHQPPPLSAMSLVLWEVIVVLRRMNNRTGTQDVLEIQCKAS